MVETHLSSRSGFNLAWGAVAFFALFWLVSLGISWLIPAGFDDSDSPPVRSGLSIRTDRLTGCQYLMTFTGALTPRMNDEGKQICKGKQP